MQVTMNRVGGEVSETAQGSRVVVSAYVSDIPASARSDGLVLLRAMTTAGLPSLFSAWEGDTRLRCTSRVVRPSGNTNDAEAELTFEGPAFGEAGSGGGLEVVVEDSTSLASELEQIDLNGKPIQAIYWAGKYAQPGDITYDPSEKPAAHTVAMNVLRPRRVISLAGTMIGRKPHISARLLVGQVNADPWPSGSLFEDDSPDPAGYWLCTNSSASLERRGTLDRLPVVSPKTLRYQFRFSAMTKVVRDWSHYGLFRNKAGKVPDGVAEKEADKIKSLTESAYTTEQQNASTKFANANAFVRVGMYRAANFRQFLGF